MMKVKFILFALLTALITGCSADDSQDNKQNGADQEETTDQDNEKQNENQSSNESDEKDEPQRDDQTKQDNQKLSKKDAEAVLQQYKETFTIETADDGTVQNFDTKQEIIKHYEQIMSEDLAKNYVNQYYTNKDGQLKIVATEQPYWLNPDNDFRLEKKDSAYHVIQQHKSELRGNREFTFVLTPSDSDTQWVVSDVTSEKQ